MSDMSSIWRRSPDAPLAVLPEILAAEDLPELRAKAAELAVQLEEMPHDKSGERMEDTIQPLQICLWAYDPAGHEAVLKTLAAFGGRLEKMQESAS